MFGFGRSKRDYNKICRQPDAVYRVLYADRSKTSQILGDENFIRAWLDSEKQLEITRILRNEAVGGDVPSLKQMVWYLGKMHADISSARIDEKTKAKALVNCLKERISFCNQLTSLGEPQHYPAMMSSFHLYETLYGLRVPGTLQNTGRDPLKEMVDRDKAVKEMAIHLPARELLDEIVRHANAVIGMGLGHPAFDNDPGFIADAQKILAECDLFLRLLKPLDFGRNLDDEIPF